VAEKGPSETFSPVDSGWALRPTGVWIPARLQQIGLIDLRNQRAEVIVPHANAAQRIPMPPVGLTAVLLLGEDGTFTYKVVKGTLRRFWRPRGCGCGQHMLGVRGVIDEITIRPSATPAEVKAKIQAAHQRNAILDAKRIAVTTSGHKVTLSGPVRS